MSDAAVLTFRAPAAEAEHLLRNAVAEIEGRLRFFLTERKLDPAFGSEPFDPADRAIASLSLGRLHLQHAVDRRPCLVILLLVGDVDANVVAALVRYLDARVRPPLPIFVLAADETGHRAHATALRASGELHAIGRSHEVAVASVRESDARFSAFCDRVSAARDVSRPVPRDTGFRDDLRRHHHLAVCPSGGAPASWRIGPLGALARHGITTSAVDPEDLRRRALWIAGTGREPLDPRLVEMQCAKPGLLPGDLRDLALALAVRDLADERLATTVTLGPSLPSDGSPRRIARILGALHDPIGRPEAPICASVDGDDAAAISQAILQRASIRVPPGPFADPQQQRPTGTALTLRIARLAGDTAELALDGLALDDPESAGALRSGPVTALRVAFRNEGSVACFLETRLPAVVLEDGVGLPLPGRGEEFLRRWPADRLAVLPGTHAARLATLLDECRFRVDRFPRG